MITKYNMASGELTYQSKPATEAVAISEPHELIELITSLQLLEIQVTPESRTIPADLLSISAREFLNRQG
jgi:hypothetical protein